VFVESFTGGPLAKRILTPLPCELWIDGERHRTTGLSLLCAAVVRDLGLGMKVCYRAAEEADRLHLVASSLAPAKLGPRAPWVMLGKSIGGEDHVDRLVRSFEVRFPSASGPYVLDGDMFRARSVEVSAGPVIAIVGPRDG
jgi:diacylglycerol kinase (ATP)